MVLLALLCPAARAQDDSCRYHGDGECDEPQYCAAGTDTADCSTVLDAAPAAVTVSGLRCHPGYAGEYELQPVLKNGKPQWARGSDHHMHWSPEYGGQWGVDDGLSEPTYIAYISSTANTPPATGTWQEYCDGTFGHSPGTTVAGQL